MVVKRLARLFGRRLPNKSDSSHRPNPSAAVPAAADQSRPRIGTVVTWESELRAIAVETSAWTVETGGDLFGCWQATPVIHLATIAGPNAVRSAAHFRLDVEYLRKISQPLAQDWGLRYFGDWHSHHRLGLSSPSSGDQRRIRQLGNRNQFPGMIEFIVTTEGDERAPLVRIHPYYYDLASDETLASLDVKVFPGCSPVREALIARGDLPEQKLRSWESISLKNVRIGNDSNAPSIEKQQHLDTDILKRTLDHLIDMLRSESKGQIEHHATAFGHIVVAPIKGALYLAFAIEGSWPMRILEVHLLDRSTGTAELISLDGALLAGNVPQLTEVFQAAKLGA